MKIPGFILCVLLILVAGCGPETETARGLIAINQEAIRKNPADALAHFTLGHIYLSQKQYQTAADHLTEAIRYKRTYAPAYRDIGLALYYLNRMEESREALRKSFFLNSNDPVTVVNLGGIQLALKNYDGAAKVLSEAIENGIDSLEIRGHLAAAYKNLGQDESAMEHLQKALEMDPDSIETHNSLGVIYENMGKNTQALEEFKTVLRANRLHAAANYNLGASLSREGKHAEALELFEKSNRIKHGSAKTLKGIGWARENLKRYDEAVVAYRQSLLAEPGSLQVLLRLAKMLELTGKYNDAAEAYLRAVNQTPRSPHLYFQLGRIYDRIQKGRKAVVNAIIADQLYLEADDARMAGMARRSRDLYIKKYGLKLKDFKLAPLPAAQG